MPPLATDLLSAALADRYRLLHEVGGGGWATVYLAQDLKHGRDVAIKVLRPEFAASLAAERFLREIATVARLQHPHIVPLLDSGKAADFLYFVMPFVEGDTLRDRLVRSGRLPIADVIRILADVADAVAHAHERGVVHRDLKPENILLSGRHALVSDFGVARAARLAAEGEQPLTVGVALGTPAYMSPEQAVASPDVDHRADIYAIGVLGYELIAGRAPFTAPTPQEVLTMHVAVRPEPLESHQPDIPPELSRVIMRCLEKRPEERWHSASELVAVLEPLATPSGGITPTGIAPTQPPTRRWWRVAALVAALGAVAVVFRPRSAEPGPPAGVTQQQLTFLGNVIDAAPSPDGMFLAYTIEDSMSQRILVRDLLGGNVVTAATAPSFVGMAWSPDGLEIRYATYRPERGIFAVPRLGGTARPLSPDYGVPSPDGARQAWIRSAPKAVKIRGPGATDSIAIELPFDYLWPLSPAWSPDGGKLAIPLLSPGGRRSSLAVVAARGERPPHEIAVDSMAKLAAVWAPDGRSIYYLALRGRVAVLFRCEVDEAGRARGRPVEIVSGLEPGMNSMKRGGPAGNLRRRPPAGVCAGAGVLQPGPVAGRSGRADRVQGPDDGHRHAPGGPAFAGRAPADVPPDRTIGTNHGGPAARRRRTHHGNRGGRRGQRRGVVAGGRPGRDRREQRRDYAWHPDLPSRIGGTTRLLDGSGRGGSGLGAERPDPIPAERQPAVRYARSRHRPRQPVDPARRAGLGIPPEGFSRRAKSCLPLEPGRGTGLVGIAAGRHRDATAGPG